VKLLFTPLSIAGGLLAGVIAGRIFKLVWGRRSSTATPGHPFASTSVAV
jgi:hypothetical protein